MWIISLVGTITYCCCFLFPILGALTLAEQNPPAFSEPSQPFVSNKAVILDDDDDDEPATAPALKLQPKQQFPKSAKRIKQFVEKKMATTKSNSNNNKNGGVPLSNNDPIRSTESIENEFVRWCIQAMGIETSLRIETFDYFDFLQAKTKNTVFEDDEPSSCSEEEMEGGFVTVEDLPFLPVRGLAASRDIQVGEVVISVPVEGLISIPTSIDHDPVLGRVLGPQARKDFGWEENGTYYEVPLLVVALLYHKHLGRHSPLDNYVEILENVSSPILSRKQLNTDLSISSGVRRIARRLQRDVRDMYNTIMVPLKEAHPQIFDDDKFSYEEFQWAFGMVNSRHWNLPIPDLKEHVAGSETKRLHVGEEENHASSGSIGLPPASAPTDEWVEEQQAIEKEEAEAAIDMPDVTVHGHPFLAPMADLLNFGPPCTRGRYNQRSRTFEIVATCPFMEGQEVTFWYSDECEDVVIANYGFTHPLVPRCPTMEELQQTNDLYRAELKEVGEELDALYTDLANADLELDKLHEEILKCDCNGQMSQQPRKTSASRKEKPPPHSKQLRDTGVRGASDDDENHQRHGVRRQWLVPRASEDLGL